MSDISFHYAPELLLSCSCRYWVKPYPTTEADENIRRAPRTLAPQFPKVRGRYSMRSAHSQLAASRQNSTNKRARLP